MKRSIFSILMSFFCIQSFAADTGNIMGCKMDLTELIVPNLKGDFNKARSFTWIDHNTNGVYSVRVYEKLSPAESAGQNSTGTIGWVEVDTIKNQIRGSFESGKPRGDEN